ncbi:hypothetical protein L0U85_09615 [Glycomyces sp. L485]|uniref:hypothetical protein n=1 Tax=Glycomyces sp. L485 TaxID=2909235 RepID=UPI001F4A9B3C|nr:hypothetical protein [Glycomyces sp. L485]MCH7231108.1 hypothetical protein [Glycomyces sp. L485]
MSRSLDDYITETDHSATLQSKLNQFERALTRRWRREAVEQIDRREPVKTFLARSSGPYGAPDVSPYMTLEVQHHKAHCAFIDWVMNGQDGDLGSVSCDGATGLMPGDNQLMYDYAYDPPRVVEMPFNIDCPIGQLMSDIEDWAWGERLTIKNKLPKFDGHDVSKLEAAYEAAEALRAATLSDYGGVDITQGEHNDLAGSSDLSGTVAKIWSKDSDSRDWWVEWSGLAAEHVKGNFCTSTGPTLINHSLIATALANLISQRAAIIEKGRNNGIYWIEQTTVKLDDHSMSEDSTDLVPGWKAVQGIGASIALYGAGTGPGAAPAAATGGAVSLLGFLGENLFGEWKTSSFPEQMEELVVNLSDRIDSLNENLETHEQEYSAGVSSARGAVNDASSFDLELYDLTENSSGGVADKGAADGYDVNISNVLTLAEHCEAAAVAYEDLLSNFSDLLDAAPHLADKNGDPTTGDEDLAAMCEELHGFFKTTAARYYLAFEEIKAAAEAYADADDTSAGSFDRTMESWGRDGVGTAEPGIDVEAAAEDTERAEGADDNPYDGALTGDGTVYYTEENSSRY